MISIFTPKNVWKFLIKIQLTISIPMIKRGVNPLSIFTSRNIWKFLIKIQLTKSNPKIIREVNSPCLMLIRVNTILPKPSQPSPLYSNHNVSVDAAADCFLYHRVAGYLLPFLLYFLFWLFLHVSKSQEFFPIWTLIVLIY